MIDYEHALTRCAVFTAAALVILAIPNGNAVIGTACLLLGTTHLVVALWQRGR